MSKNPDYIIRRMRREEVDLAVDWAAAEGWNPGLYDAECFWAVDPEGWWIGLLNDQLICLKSAVAYDAHFGFMGFYITQPEYRGHGYGLELWQQANASLSPRNVGMDGVVAQQANYTKSGYHYAYRQMRFSGPGGCVQPNQSAIVDLREFPLAALSAYDRRHFPALRENFLKLWISRPGTVALGYLEQNQLVGYAVLRPCRQGFKVGPLFADRPEIAESLFSSLRARVSPDQPVFIDVPEPNVHALKLVEQHQLSYVFETARMYTQEPPELPLEEIYGITSFELG